jgi:threonine dehydratase
MIPIEDIRQAAHAMENMVIKTPLLHAPTLSRMFGGQVYLKLENLQKTGSFKIRGATYKLLRCRDRIGSGGVVAASAGNHAQGVALAARQLGVEATIVMPEWVSIGKQEATRAYQGRVIIHGQSVGESLEKARELAQEDRTFIHPFEDPDVITGQGTIGLEIFEQLADPDLIVVPVGGGGLISGIASAARQLNPDTQVIGVQTAECPGAYESFLTGAVTKVEGKSSIADGISVKQVGERTFEIIRRCVDDMALVQDEQIAAAVLMLLERKKILAEGSGAAPLAAVLTGAVKLPREGNTVLVISGGNVDSPLLGRIIDQGLIKSGRVMRVQVRMADVPGSLAHLLRRVAETKANVLHIFHDRHVAGTPLYVTHVQLELETRGPRHVKEIEQALSESGYTFEIR